jgi:hypothetical protein
MIRPGGAGPPEPFSVWQPLQSPVGTECDIARILRAQFLEPRLRGKR